MVNLPWWAIPGALVAVLSLVGTLFGVGRIVERHKGENASKRHVDGRVEETKRYLEKALRECRREQEVRLHVMAEDQRDIYRKIDETRQLVGSISVSVGRIEGHLFGGLK